MLPEPSAAERSFTGYFSVKSTKMAVKAPELSDLPSSESATADPAILASPATVNCRRHAP